MHLATLLRPARALLAVTALAAPSAVFAQEKSGQRRDELVAVVDRVKASVVNIHSERMSSSHDETMRTGVQAQRVNGMGTGIVLDPRGYIVTNYHVVDDVQSLRCRLVDGTTCPARVIAVDKESDLALIKIEPPRPLPVSPLGTATDLMLAERVIAIGNAFGYENTVSLGNVSALKRDVTLNKEVSYKSLIQTQAPINPGNSGGPLFNKLGEVVGVNVAIRAGAQNIAFAIPVDTMIAKAAEMLSLKRRLNLRHGLAFTDLCERPAEDAGLRRWVRVARVEPGTPAFDAGFQSGDIVEKVGELPVATTIDFERGLIDRPLNSPIAVRVRRGDTAAESSELKLTLSGTATTTTAFFAPTADAVQRRLGLKIVAVGPDVVARVNTELRGGLYLDEVAPGSSAARAGLTKGDILIGLHQWESLSVDNVLFVLNHKDLATFAPLKAHYIRDGKLRDTVVTPD